MRKVICAAAIALGILIASGDGGAYVLTQTDGYQVKDSQETDGPQYLWNDISVTGGTMIASSQWTWTNVTTNGYLDGYAGFTAGSSPSPFPLGFNFTFFGTVYTHCWISAKGFLVLSSSSTTAPSGMDDFTNDDIPNSVSPNNYVAPFWDDLCAKDYSSANKFVLPTVYFKTDGASGAKQFIVQWKNVRHYSYSGDVYDFELILWEQSNGILFQYGTMTGTLANGSGATVGIENSTGTAGTKYLYLGSPNTIPAGVTPNRAVGFLPTTGTTPATAPWPLQGAVVSGSSSSGGAGGVPPSPEKNICGGSVVSSANRSTALLAALLALAALAWLGKRLR